ncbi:MAG: hypothetical protein QMC81_11045 [Thermoanaerobacterales bacterium]|nr:hypothetical protein [Bacillota bacterium]MDI6908004.1 hypothetical protein [Thermoanaerobacterales bacterium]
MELKQAINRFHHGEKLKSYLITASGMFAEMTGLKDRELAVAVRLTRAYLEQVRGELRMAAYLAELPRLSEVEARIKSAVWEAHINRPTEANRLMGEAISLVVSGLEEATQYLKDRSLI